MQQRREVNRPQRIGARSSGARRAVRPCGRATTLAVAAAFQPLRRRIQWAVDRRFYRSRYDARQTVERFSAQLRDAVDVDVLARELLSVVGRALQPVHASLWTTSTGRRRRTDGMHDRTAPRRR